MANYYAHARSNYFGVKDENKFVEWAKKRNLDHWSQGRLFAISPSDQDDCGSWPWCIMDEETEEDEEFDILAELSEHLLDGHVAVIQEVGNEKLRYLIGLARAINSKGEEVSISINDIYEKAKSLGDHITEAQY